MNAHGVGSSETWTESLPPGLSSRLAWGLARQVRSWVEQGLFDEGRAATAYVSDWHACFLKDHFRSDAISDTLGTLEVEGVKVWVVVVDSLRGVPDHLEVQCGPEFATVYTTSFSPETHEIYVGMRQSGLEPSEAESAAQLLVA